MKSDEMLETFELNIYCVNILQTHMSTCDYYISIGYNIIYNL